MIITGTKFYGRVDQVPGLFNVATKFFHLWYVPVIPLETWIILHGTETAESFRGQKIGLSFKSIMLGWLRGAAVVGMIAAILQGIAAYNRPPGKPVPWGDGLGGAALLLGACVFFYWVTTKLGQPSRKRAMWLAEAVGLDKRLVAEYYDGPEQLNDDDGATD